MAQLIIASSLTRFTENNSSIELDAPNVKAALDEVMAKYPAIKGAITDEGGKLRKYVNIFVDDVNIRNLNNEQTALTTASQVMLLSAISGG